MVCTLLEQNNCLDYIFVYLLSLACISLLTIKFIIPHSYHYRREVVA